MRNSGRRAVLLLCLGALGALLLSACSAANPSKTQNAAYLNSYPLTVLVLGDSVALSLAFDMGAVAPAYHMRIYDAGMLGCGITDAQVPLRSDEGNIGPPPSYCFQWQQYWKGQVDIYRPDVSVILIGRWEGLDSYYDGHWTHLGEPDFDAYILKQLKTAIVTASSDGALTVVLGTPYYKTAVSSSGQVFDQDSPQRIDVLHHLEREAVSQSSSAAYLDLASYIEPHHVWQPDFRGVRIFTSDGVHFQPGPAAKLIGPWLFEHLRQEYLKWGLKNSSFINAS